MSEQIALEANDAEHRWREMLRPDLLGPALAQATGDPAWSDFSAELIAGGKSNLTFALSSTAGRLVLRRPPSGELLPSAHDMGREARVQRALAGQLSVPQIVLFDQSGEVLGVPFYVMREVDGWVIRDRLPDGYADDVVGKRAIADALLDQLTNLHSIDPIEVGLDGFGRPEGFLSRQVRRWAAQSEATGGTADLRGLQELGRRLAARVPDNPSGSIVHGDFRLDNCILDRDDPGRVAAVLDWELCTLGDPLTDLSLWLFYWSLPGEPEVPLVPSVTSLGGFPDRDYLVTGYARRTGRDLSALPFYQALSRFKFAVIARGVAARSAAGTMGGQSFENVDADIARVADEGLAILSDWTP
ncbi:phosphotransferase family protein [Nocardioides sp.]|uniref:phosphotransferase family protein n=1 Tax=Nocardioides sp. TaxID=35761 RepID=UPI002CE02FB0|nr:phosphotransferase family protein [Nocardioides sp.]HSX66861.1 phosphotransferase family protein [Nocardioides sp.]